MSGIRLYNIIHVRTMNYEFEIVIGKEMLLKGVQYDHATNLTKAIQEIGDAIGWTNDQKTRLLLADNSVLKPTHDKVVGAVSRRKNQECDTFEMH